MQEVSVNHEVGSTDSQQTAVASGQAVAQAESDIAGARYSSAGSPRQSSGEGGYWKPERGTRVAPEDNLRLSKEQRLHALENDGTHFSAPHYKYDTSRSTEASNAHRRRDGVQLTYVAFSDVLPNHVSLDAVMRTASRIDADGLSPYGGLRLVGFVAILSEMRLEAEDLFLGSTDSLPEDFREVFAEHFSDAQMDTHKVLQRAVQVLAGLEQ